MPTVGAALIDAKGARVEGLLPPNSPGHMRRENIKKLQAIDKVSLKMLD